MPDVACLVGWPRPEPGGGPPRPARIAKAATNLGHRHGHRSHRGPGLERAPGGGLGLLAALVDRTGGGTGVAGPGQVRGLPPRHPQRQGHRRRPRRAVELGRRLVLEPGRPRLPRGRARRAEVLPPAAGGGERHPPRHLPPGRHRHRVGGQRQRPGRHRRPLPAGQIGVRRRRRGPVGGLAAQPGAGGLRHRHGLFGSAPHPSGRLLLLSTPPPALAGSRRPGLPGGYRPPTRLSAGGAGPVRRAPRGPGHRVGPTVVAPGGGAGAGGRAAGCT